MAKYSFARAAHGDLEEIEEYTLATWGESQRDRYLEGLFAQFELIADNPQIGVAGHELAEVSAAYKPAASVGGNTIAENFPLRAPR